MSRERQSSSVIYVFGIKGVGNFWGEVKKVEANYGCVMRELTTNRKILNVYGFWVSKGMQWDLNFKKGGGI